MDLPVFELVRTKRLSNKITPILSGSMGPVAHHSYGGFLRPSGILTSATAVFFYNSFCGGKRLFIVPPDNKGNLTLHSLSINENVLRNPTPVTLAGSRTDQPYMNFAPHHKWWATRRCHRSSSLLPYRLLYITGADFDNLQYMGQTGASAAHKTRPY